MVKIKIVSREEWGALPPSQPPEPLQTPVSHVVVYPETDSMLCHDKKECIKKMKEVQKSEMEKGNPDIKYNFLVAFDGRVYEGRGWNVRPASIKNKPELDGNFISIAYIGNFEDWVPPYLMTSLAEKLIKFGIEQNYIDKGYRRGNIVWNTGKVYFDDTWRPKKKKINEDENSSTPAPVKEARHL